MESCVAFILFPCTTSSPLTSPDCTGCCSVTNCPPGQGPVAADRIWTGCVPWFVNDSTCGLLACDNASGPKSNSGTDGTTALRPIPEIGKVKEVSESRLSGAIAVIDLLTLSVAPSTA